MILARISRKCYSGSFSKWQRTTPPQEKMPAAPTSCKHNQGETEKRLDG